MALQLPWDAYGVTFPAAYARVERCSVHDGQYGNSYLTVYTDDTKQHAVGEIGVPFILDKSGDNIHTQAYAAAKLLPEFAGAVDV
jgi:hypothetical protein